MPFFQFRLFVTIKLEKFCLLGLNGHGNFEVLGENNGLPALLWTLTYLQQLSLSHCRLHLVR